MISFDMDGVLAIYDREGSKIGEDGYPMYMHPEYFYHRQPNETAINLFKKCYKLFPNDLYILTTVPDGHCRNNIVIDKLKWINLHIPEFDIGTHVICCTSNKMSFIEWIRGSTIKKNDILIDDYNTNLYSWYTRGGTAIKWLNGINSRESWCGPVLDQNEDNLLKSLMGILDGSIR